VQGKNQQGHSDVLLIIRQVLENTAPSQSLRLVFEGAYFKTGLRIYSGKGLKSFGFLLAFWQVLEMPLSTFQLA